MEWTTSRRLGVGAIAVLCAVAGVAAATTGPASGTPSSGQTVDLVAAGHLADRIKLDTKGPVDVVTLKVTGGILSEEADAPSHVLVDEGTDPVVVYATFFLADGAAPVIDAPQPPVCAGTG